MALRVITASGSGDFAYVMLFAVMDGAMKAVPVGHFILGPFLRNSQSFFKLLRINILNALACFGIIV